ncbi:hypothetical protein [Mesorhizobium captivum]|uniref:hypothetical protein n=1 Tax=Mesorhizobium captivum TaxID=3072319 RepID=UPI002A23EB78|nr:hypothetical protein [Mesorhizobium sp. VK3C]MDX8448128.1 hypothetical protein [Mesorhizobium sp. VK3C]
MLRADTIRALLESLPDEMELRQSEAKVVIGCPDTWLDCRRLYGYGLGSNGLIRYPVAYLRERISQHTVDPATSRGANLDATQQTSEDSYPPANKRPQ